MKKNVKGITLVSLVITIIVMLILAGVSISMATGNNGVLTQGKEASIKTTLGTIESDITLAGTSVMSAYWGEFAESTSKAGNKATYVTPERLNKELNECYFLTNATSKGTIKAPKDSSATIATNTYKGDNTKGNIQSVALASMAGVSSGKSSQDTSATGYIEKVGYVCNCFYFSNGVNQNTAGGDLYVVLVHFKDEEMFVDNVGVAQNNSSSTLTQGELANSTFFADNGKFGIDNLNVEWLKKDVKP